jgi:hypothetical protein
MLDDLIHANGTLTHIGSTHTDGYSNKELVEIVRGPYEIVRLEAVMPGFVLVANRTREVFATKEPLALNTTASTLAGKDVYGTALLCPTDRVD